MALCNFGIYDEFGADGRPPRIGTTSMSVRLVAGRTYDITHSLTAYTFLGSGIYLLPDALIAGAFATADFSQGASFTLTPVSPGAGYTTASGHRYDGPTTNTAPTASAGQDQVVRPGSTVTLDGTGSYDDNTSTNQLQFAWSFSSVPSGSGVTLTHANTATPTFVPDVAGSYVIQLVVTDEGGLSSAPAQVTIGENPPPSANAGPDQLVIVNNVVSLAGVGVDPNGDSLTYAWALTGTPTDSVASLASAGLADTTFVPDRPGVYVAQLTVSDVVGPGAPDSVRITAITAATYAEMQIQDAGTQILGLPTSAVTNRGNQNALTQFLSNAIGALHDGSLTTARQQLEQAISRTDGCALRGAPDGNGPGRDWITTCGGQNAIYETLLDALSVIPQ
jgi:K319L-like, PKD domain